MKFILPKPPSINHIYGFTSRGGFARSYITQEGKAWFEEAGYRIKKIKQNTPSFATSIEISIKLFTSRRQDIDNITKPILDILQKQGVYLNDVLVTHLDIEKIKCKKEEERVEIDVNPLEIS